MENEISNGAMLGIVLIALAAIIGLGFGIFAIARGTANEGITDVQDSLGAVSDSMFTDYDQKVVTGTQILSSYQSFEGKPYALLVATQATKDIVKAEGIAAGAGIAQAYENGDLLPQIKAYRDKEMQTEYDVLTSDGEDVHLTFINYNALLGSTESNKKMLEDTAGSKYKPSEVEATVYFDSNTWRATQAFAIQDNRVMFNNISVNMNKAAMLEYVPPSARYQAYLIKDVSGSIMGMAFEQIRSK